ncbi:MAG: hypothetical protein KZQ90_11555 [Candidatus Thiodiazotropha sp. (ex Codakia rugifera)]|nr:hypothetical protein [Candidatus Thiodiazotropha sp. (ex Codakia rugifera)]
MSTKRDSYPSTTIVENRFQQEKKKYNKKIRKLKKYSLFSSIFFLLLGLVLGEFGWFHTPVMKIKDVFNTYVGTYINNPESDVGIPTINQRSPFKAN